MTERRRGLFLTFEGVDGSGKTTQMRRLAERLRNEGEAVVETVEPGGTEIGKQIRQILLNPEHHEMGPVTELLLYFAARAQNVDEMINPAIQAGKIVLADRYTDSTLAYQGAGRGLGEGVVRALHEVACRGRNPDLTFLIEVDVSTSLARARARNRMAAGGGSKDSRMDEQERSFYERAHVAYQRMASSEPARFRRIDGSGTPEEVSDRVWGEFVEFRSRHVR
jgi:dTMP kinase